MLIVVENGLSKHPSLIDVLTNASDGFHQFSLLISFALAALKSAFLNSWNC